MATRQGPEARGHPRSVLGQVVDATARQLGSFQVPIFLQERGFGGDLMSEALGTDGCFLFHVRLCPEMLPCFPCE